MARNDINWEQQKQTDFSNANAMYALGNDTIQKAFDKGIELVKKMDTDVKTTNQAILNNFLSGLSTEELANPETRLVYDNLVDSLRYDGGGVNLDNTITAWNTRNAQALTERNAISEAINNEIIAKKNHDADVASKIANITLLAKSAESQEEANKLMKEVSALAGTSSNPSSVLGLAGNIVSELEAKNAMNSASRLQHLNAGKDALYRDAEATAIGYGRSMWAGTYAANAVGLTPEAQESYRNQVKASAQGFLKALEGMPEYLRGKVLSTMAQEQNTTIDKLIKMSLDLAGISASASRSSSGGSGGANAGMPIATDSTGAGLTAKDVQKLANANNFFGENLKQGGDGSLYINVGGMTTTLNSKLNAFAANFDKSLNMTFDEWVASEGSKLPQVKVGINGNYNGTSLLLEKLRQDPDTPDIQKIRMAQIFANEAPSDNSWTSYLMNWGKNDVQDDAKLYEQLKTKAKNALNVEASSRDAKLPQRVRAELFPQMLEGGYNNIVAMAEAMVQSDSNGNKVYPQFHELFWRALNESERAEFEKLGYTNPLKSKK